MKLTKRPASAEAGRFGTLGARCDLLPTCAGRCGDSSGERAFEGAVEHACEAVGPGVLRSGVADQVLPDLELDVELPAALAVRDDRVVRRVAERVGFVVAHEKLAVLTQEFEQRARK